MPQKMWLSQRYERLIIVGLPLAAFVFLVLALKSGPFFEFVVTATVMSILALFGSVLRGTPADGVTPFNPKLTSRFGLLRDAIAAHPIWRLFVSSLALRVGSATAFGILVATLIQGVHAALFGESGMPYLVSGVLSQAIVLLLTYWLLGYLRSLRHYVQSPWIADINAGIEQALGRGLRDLPTWKRTLAMAVLATLGAVVARVITLLSLPMLFSNWFFVGFFVCIVLSLAYGGDVLLPWVRSVANFRMTSSSDPGGEPKTNPNERNAS